MEILPDLGPVYTETNLNRFPVEPFNTLSNILFLIITVYWYRKKKNVESENFRFFLDSILPLLLIGYVGGTVYHATRSYVLWMAMDVAPIYVIAFFSSLYHWHLIGLQGFRLILIFTLIFGLPEVLLWTVFNGHPQRHTIGYGILFFCILLPILIDEFRQNWTHLGLILKPFFCVIVALGFRVLDSSFFIRENFSIGTHWLWHIFGALGCHLTLSYMYQRSMVFYTDRV